MTSHKRELFFGLIRIHVLLHAAQEPIFGLGMMEELRHHDYRIGPGTLYPLLHGLERAGLLKSAASDSCRGAQAEVYRITAAGKRALAKAAVKVDEAVPRTARGTTRADLKSRPGMREGVSSLKELLQATDAL